MRTYVRNIKFYDKDDENEKGICFTSFHDAHEYMRSVVLKSLEYRIQWTDGTFSEWFIF